jgi:hypothetical protein
MSGKMNQQVLLSDVSSSHLELVRACQSPCSDGGECITRREGRWIEISAMRVVAQAEEARVAKRQQTQIDHRGPLAGYDERTQRDINALRDLLREVEEAEKELPRQGCDLTGAA